jgi:uncharacterized membrane protein
MRRRLDAILAEQRSMLSSRAGRIVVAAVVLMALWTLGALAVLWPRAAPRTAASGITVASRSIDAAVVEKVELGNCPAESRPGCENVTFRLRSGPTSGTTSRLTLPGDEASPRLSPGDHIRVTPSQGTAYGTVTAEQLAQLDPSKSPYTYVDFERGRPLLILALLFVGLVIGLGRRVGAAAVVAIAIGMLLLTSFVVPAILDGTAPLAVALVGSFAAMYATIVPVYGIGAKSLAALLGTAVSLVVTGALGLIFVHAAHITGTSGEDATLILGVGGGRVSLSGLVLAGMIIGALGVLSDVTVSQSSTVLALRRSNPSQPLSRLYRAAEGVGRDHLGATVYTLVFAYAGAALPLLLLFSSQDVTFGDAVNREVVASEIVAALVGSIGLIVAVPLTTFTACLLAVRLPPEVLGIDHHVHSH